MVKREHYLEWMKSVFPWDTSHLEGVDVAMAYCMKNRIIWGVENVDEAAPTTTRGWLCGRGNTVFMPAVFKDRDRAGRFAKELSLDMEGEFRTVRVDFLKLFIETNGSKFIRSQGREPSRVRLRLKKKREPVMGSL